MFRAGALQVMAQGRRRYTIVHEQYLVEWLMRNYPAGTWRTNVRLGKVTKDFEKAALTPEERRALKLWTLQADAIVLLEDKVVVGEALVRPEWWKIWQLKEYEKAFRVTEEFREHWNKPIELVLLTTQDSPYHLAMARELGIRVVKYRPAWIEEYLSYYAIRKRRPPGAYMAPT